MITIKDIAKLANVSVSTVSKALNDKPDIGENTKRRILEIAKEHNFTPHAFGKGLKKRSSENVGVLFCRDLHSLSGNPFYSRVLEGIEAELALNDFSLLLQIITESTPDVLPKMIRERIVDGLILVGTFRDSYLKRLLDTHLPVVIVDPSQRIMEQCQVLIDNEHGAFQATQHLINQGHRHIGFISGNLARISFQQRFDGYMKALRLYNIDLNDHLIKTGGLENGYELVGDLLDSGKITAIFSANDINAISGYKAIHERGLRIPDDISIIGFDDIELAKLAAPPLTTVRVYKEELGSIAVRSLLRRIQSSNEKPMTTIVPTKLIERDSVKSLN